jgi:hypothetical protein
MDSEEIILDKKNNNFPIITIKSEVPTLNDYIRSERSNKYKAAKAKKASTMSVAKEVLSQTRDIINTKVNIDVVWYIKSDHDPDNIYFGIKFILDGIVVSGLLRGDSQKEIGYINNSYVRGNEYKVVLKFCC